MKNFKFFQKKPERVFTDYMDQMDDYFLGGIQPMPQGLDISRRHWNLLPEDIKRLSSLEIMAYIEGWETEEAPVIMNPYIGNFRLGNIWTRGWQDRQRRNERLNRMDETYPEYYNTDEFEFVDVSPIYYTPESFVPQKYMMFRCRNTGTITQGNLIDPTHPMWNFPDIM